MKKFLMIAVAAMAVASRAASLSWQVSSTTADGFASGQTALLFVGGADETFSYNGTDNLTLSDYVAALLTDGADKATTAAFDTAVTSSVRGKVSTAPKDKDISYEVGSQIVGMIVVLDGNGKYNAFSFAEEVALVGTQMNTSAAASSTGFQDLPSGGGSQDDIPEPATGALALAGVALLFKRRRA